MGTTIAHSSIDAVVCAIFHLFRITLITTNFSNFNQTDCILFVLILPRCSLYLFSLPHFVHFTLGHKQYTLSLDLWSPNRSVPMVYPFLYLSYVFCLPIIRTHITQRFVSFQQKAIILNVSNAMCVYGRQQQPHAIFERDRVSPHEACARENI